METIMPGQATRSESAPPGYQTMMEVKNIQSNLLRAISGQTRSGLKNEEVFNSIIQKVRDKEKESLIQLYKYYRDREANALSSLKKISGSTLEEKIKNLKKQVKKWNETAGALITPGRSLDTAITNIAKSVESFGILSLGAVLSATQDLQEQYGWGIFSSLFEEELKDLPQDTANAISAGLMGGYTSEGRSRRGTLYIKIENASDSLQKSFLKGKKRNGINIRVTNNKTQKSNKDLLITVTGDMASKDRKDIHDKFRLLLENAEKKDTHVSHEIQTQLEVVTNAIINSIANLIPNPQDPAVKNKIMDMAKELIITQQSIAISKNRNVIRGMLGELYWAAFFSYIGCPVIPTGTLLDESGKQIPVDSILGAFNFQVKAYKTYKEGENEALYVHRKVVGRNNGELEYDGARDSLLSFLRTKVGANTDAFGEFYFSQAFNKEVSGREAVWFPNHAVFAPVEARFAPISEMVEIYCQADPLRVLGWEGRTIQKVQNDIANSISSDIEVFSKPLAFLINDEIILASTMIKKVIDALSGTSDVPNESVVFEVEDFEIQTVPLKRLWPYDPEISEENYLSMCKVKYDIKIDFSALIKSQNESLGMVTG